MCTKGPECKIQRFGPGGCKVPICGQICGNTDTLEIANEFNRAYEAKIRLIEQEKGPDLQQDKLKLQREWIEDLREQNKMLACAIQELEYEAAHRVLCLEEKLKESAKCICEVMKKYREHDVASDLLSEPLQRIFDLENDQNELIELIRRGKDENNWSYHDLRFLTINPSELFGTSEYEEPEKFAPDGQSLDSKVREQLCQRDAEFQASLKEYQRSNKCVADLEQKLKYYMSLGNVEVVYEDLKRAKTEYDTLKRQMEDMRQALTEEVASKHDLILAMKRDCQQLEERCLQADKQTAFKDDIIKELRKEIKQLKQQTPEFEKPQYLSMNQDQSSEVSLSSQDSYLNDIYCVKANHKPLVTINHSRKSIQSGKSTVIYIYKERSDKSVQPEKNGQPEREKPRKNDDVNQRSSRRNHETVDTMTACGDVAEKSLLHSCKSENDLEEYQPWRNVLRPVKEKSKFTTTSLSRSNTFVSSCESDDKTIRVPNHMPVKMHVQNIEKGYN